MQEGLLQYIWQFQYFNTSGLHTSSGEPISIVHPGKHNNNQGPDFTGAKIKIGNMIWAGNVELHINSSDWNVHHHSGDTNYNNIILHVIWNDDATIKDPNGIELPALELRNRVSKVLLEKYRQLMEGAYFIPCERLACQVNDPAPRHWRQQLVDERLIDKSGKIAVILHETSFHWEETFWWLIAAAFGLTVNSDFFQKVARSLPIALLAKHKSQLLQIEALLFGQAGLLNESFIDKYPLMLQKEYRFYQTKYKLKIPDGELFFLRMRPANFPTVRLAQLSALIHQSQHLFSKIIDATSLEEARSLLDVKANDYWHYHYVFEQESEYKEKKLGSRMINTLMINTIVPLLFAYGKHHDNMSCKVKAMRWLNEISAEKNRITSGFELLGFPNKNAFDSQALIQLKNEYCNKKQCLRCSLGNTLLKREP